MIRIRHNGLLGFAYECVVNGRRSPSDRAGARPGLAAPPSFGHPQSAEGVQLFDVDVTDAVVTLDHESRVDHVVRAPRERPRARARAIDARATAIHAPTPRPFPRPPYPYPSRARHFDAFRRLSRGGKTCSPADV